MDSEQGRQEVTWREMRAYFPHRALANHVFGLPDHGIVYVKNPKVACSTLLLWMDRMQSGEHDFSPTNVHTENRLPTAHDIGRKRLARMISGGAFRFSFVRDPLTRFHSVYVDKMVRTRPFRTQVQEALGQEPDLNRKVTIDEFVAALERQDPVSEMDPHWRPQHVNLMLPLVTYDHIGRLETFDDDLELIRKAAGLPHVPHEVRNVRGRLKESVLADRPDLEERVRAIYAEDFELFGY